MSNTIFHSQEDASVNFVTEGDFPGKIEARYVRRTKDAFICYLSSATGCNLACRMCHLTQTGQTKMQYCTIADYVSQAEQVLAYAQTQEQVRFVHFNFMSRGDVFDNPHVLDDGAWLLHNLSELALESGFYPKFKLSTIYPQQLLAKELHSVLGAYQPDIYYSLYSMNPDFRKRWLPKAVDPIEALCRLREYQRITRKIIVLHWAFIKGQNDSQEDMKAICKAVKDCDLRVDFNVVRYNPFSPVQGEESDAETIKRRTDEFQSAFPEARVKIVSRVGFDVKASCGMFQS